MPRVSKRDILPALRAVKVDVSGKGQNVSDDIQLVYIVDDIREPLYAYGAVGEYTDPAANFLHILQLQCLNRRGLIIDEMVGVHSGLVLENHLVVKVNTSDDPEPNISPPGGKPEPLGISEGKPTKAVVVSGEVPKAQFNGTRAGFTVSFGMNSLDAGSPVRWCTADGVLKGLFVGFNRFLIMMSNQSGADSQWSLRWHELGD